MLAQPDKPRVASLLKGMIAAKPDREVRELAAALLAHASSNPLDDAPRHSAIQPEDVEQPPAGACLRLDNYG